MTGSRALRALWLAVGLQLAGRLVDLRWHLTHDEFEATAQQFQAHWLLWIGVIATLGVAAWAVRRPKRLRGYWGYALTLASALFYVPVSVWHFIEHANGTDPQLAHVLLGVGQSGMVAGAITATVIARKEVRAPTRAPGTTP